MDLKVGRLKEMSSQHAFIKSTIFGLSELVRNDGLKDFPLYSLIFLTIST